MLTDEATVEKDIRDQPRSETLLKLSLKPE